MHSRRSYDFPMSGDRERSRDVAASVHDPRALDPKQELVNTGGMSDAEVAQIVRVLDAIRGWRDAEQRIMFESRNHMQLGENDMKALRFLVLCKNQGIVATPGSVSDHLGISTAATTKLLDRLEEGRVFGADWIRALGAIPNLRHFCMTSWSIYTFG